MAPGYWDAAGPAERSAQRPWHSAPMTSTTATGPRTGQLDDAVALLTAWRPDSAQQEALRQRYLETLAAGGPDALAKAAGPVHLTASLVVLDEDLEHILLTLHRKARMWLQFGGHVEEGDATLAAAALREGREESGLALEGARPVPADLDAHLLGGGFTCREHLDVRFAVAVPHEAPAVSVESLDVAWWPVSALPEPCGPDVPALLERARAALRA